MDDAPHIGPDMRDLMATVGELLLFWGFLENTMRERMSPMEPSDPRNSKAPLLMRWREAQKAARADDSKLAKLVADIDEVAVIRNCIAHGLMSASANPWSSEEPTIICVTSAGGRRSITMSEMTDARARLHSLTNQVRDL